MNPKTISKAILPCTMSSKANTIWWCTMVSVPQSYDIKWSSVQSCHHHCHIICLRSTIHKVHNLKRYAVVLVPREGVGNSTYCFQLFVNLLICVRLPVHHYRQHFSFHCNLLSSLLVACLLLAIPAKFVSLSFLVHFVILNQKGKQEQQQLLFVIS